MNNSRTHKARTERKRLKRRMRHNNAPTADTVSARHAFVYGTQGSRQWVGGRVNREQSQKIHLLNLFYDAVRNDRTKENENE